MVFEFGTNSTKWSHSETPSMLYFNIVICLGDFLLRHPVCYINFNIVICLGDFLLRHPVCYINFNIVICLE